MVFDELDQKNLGLMEKFDFQNLTTIRNGLGGPNKNRSRPPPEFFTFPGGGQSQKSQMLPRDGIDQKTGQNFDWSFFKQNDTKLEAKLHFF